MYNFVILYNFVVACQSVYIAVDGRECWFWLAGQIYYFSFSIKMVKYGEQKNNRNILK